MTLSAVMNTKPIRKSSQGTIRNEHLRALVLLQVAVILPLLLYLPVLLGLVLLGVSVFLLKFNSQSKPVKKSALLVVTLFSLALVLMFHGQYNMVEMMFGVLSLSFILKLLEIRRAEDGYPLIYLAFILIAANLIFNPSLFATLYSGACIVYVIALWRYLYSHAQSEFQTHVRWSLLFLAKAVPLFIILFFAMPRFNPIWNLPGPTQATTGFSDNLDLTDISELAQDTSTAFRATFTTKRPSYEALYWHGIYLTHYDGKVWTASLSNAPVPDSAPQANVENVDWAYSILLEPHHQNQLFHLGKILQFSTTQRDIRLHDDGSLASHRPITKRLSYRIEASATGQLHQVVSLDQYRQLPTGNPRTRALIEQWQAEGLHGKALIDRALNFFANNFRYSLTPPSLGNEQIDDFLFNTRVGFCGHFASSFAVMLRMANLPTRIVSGYMGGTYNPVEDYLRVQQSDAHAWVEVFIDNRWQRFDPTRVVAPERLTLEPEARSNQSRDIQVTSYFTQGSFLHRLELQWDAIDYAWQRLVIEFNQDDYLLRLENWLGLRPLWIGVSAIGLIISVLLAGTLLPRYSLTKSKSPQAKAIRAWQKLEKRLAKRGIVRSAQQTPEQFLTALASTNPSAATKIDAIAFNFRQILYANKTDYWPQLKSAISKLNPRQLSPVSHQDRAT